MKTGKTKLRKDIKKFSRIKGLFAVPLILIGLLGLVLPIIPGTVFLLLGLVLIIPSLKKKLKKMFGKNLETNP